MPRQVIEIDVSFTNGYDSLTTKEILKLLVDKTVKNLVITNTNKKKEEK